MRRILFFMTIAVGIFIFTAAAFAEDMLYDEAEPYQDGFIRESSVDLFALGKSEQGAYDAIAAAMRRYDDSVNLTLYRLTPNQLKSVLAKVIDENPEFFYINNGYSYSLLGNYVTKVVFTYRYDKSKIPEMVETIDAEVKIALSYIEDNMSDFEKALVIHNYIVTNYEYDYSYSIANIYDFVDKKTGVCQAYSLMYMYIMEKIEIPCVTVPSAAMQHIWNMVQIDGQWYHADLTYDDPNVNGVGDVIGYCSYKYFLKSDNYMYNDLQSDGTYRSWECDYAAESLLYDESFLSSFNTQVIYVNGSWYVAQGTSIKEIDLQTGSGSVIFASSTSSAPYGWLKYSSLNIAPYGQYIIYNTCDTIFCLKPGEKQAEGLYRLSDTGVNINGLAISGSIVTFQTAENRYSASATVYKMDISEALSPYDFAIKSMEIEEGKIRVKYTVDTLFDGKYTVYAAGFDEDGSLVFVKEITDEIDAEEAFLYKAFIWSDTKPLCESVTVQ